MGLLTVEDLKNPKKLGVFFTIIAAIAFIGGTFIAMFFYPGGYNFFFNYFSHLGLTRTTATHPVPNAPNVISFYIFYVVVIITGIAVIPFSLVIRTLFTEDKKTNIIATIGSIVAIASSPFLMGVAIFPGDLFPSVGGVKGLHAICAQNFFLIFAVAIMIYAVAIVLHKEYANGYAIYSIALAVLAILYALIDMAMLDAFMQKMVVYLFISWVLINGIKVWNMVET